MPQALVLEAVDQGQPAGSDDVVGDADRPPRRLAIGGNDEHAGAGGGSTGAIDDADFVIGQPDVVDPRVEWPESLAQSCIKGVDRAVSLLDSIFRHAANLDFDRSLASGGTVHC